jgi:hypothetical protein
MLHISTPPEIFFLRQSKECQVIPSIVEEIQSYKMERRANADRMEDYRPPKKKVGL